MFTGNVDVRLRPSGQRILLSKSVWQLEFDNPDSKVTTAPAGMLFDGASVPALFAALNGPSIQLGAAHHDWLYRTHKFDDGTECGRLQADRIMRQITAVAQRRARKGLPTWKQYLLTVTHFVQRWLVNAGLFVGGWMAWRKSFGRPTTDDATLDEIQAVLTAIAKAVHHEPAKKKRPTKKP